MDLSLPRLRMLRELHRRGTITAAATALHYTASAVSQQLAQLERDVGTRLFERRGRRVQLTAGVWASVASGLLPDALTALARTHPGVEVRTRELAPEETAAAVRDGELDLSFVIDYSNYPMTWDKGLERAVIAVERLYAAVPAGAVPTASVTLAELAEHPWIVSPARSHFGHAVRLAFQAAGFRPRIDHEVEEQATAMAMVAAGLGVTLVTDLGLALRPPGVDVVALGDTLTRTVSLAYRTGSARRAALMLVVDAVRTSAAEKGLGADTTLPVPAPAPAPEEPAPAELGTEGAQLGLG
ncbi:LysR family transcriptional regulator [Pseudonocardia sp. EC080610-09]|uniref:LysR family transcriptional regulator n=1 Tax=unclassified Pseudonocardia TaxID=2619320 RepID=UPI000705C55C|nr:MULTISPECIES: LysR family transcriptional regulator [unclassified Pseudonocardia]ALL78716.1 LysR family transcriptional regulator [Pseudonocardia sp. EC080610-09]ALL84921.1 LysR family transcriptional regulator [Pseudonocardia sp. EC080619-01]